MPLQSGVKAMPSGLAAAGLGNSRLGLGQLPQSGQVWPRNVLCRQPKQLERKSPGVSAPCLATQPHIPTRSAATAQPDPKNSSVLGWGLGGRNRGTLRAQLSHRPFLKWRRLHCFLYLASASKHPSKTTIISEVTVYSTRTRYLALNKISFHVLIQVTQ